ncbi:hypothetical protein K2173_004411 [Erythroxylum novogranatense]|uniref:Gnk2-homologous domain-containing protein n=1 Tax=Erythroxylum novogranatense TaxID=1862640 RepID=A0AAV8T4E5_9ROSI|nr:hypothetical protein K2173_004411 [Erythroxylum novogranatense]
MSSQVKVITGVNQFHQSLNILINRLTNEASSGDSNRKYATGSMLWENLITVYAMVQCTPDLTFDQCNDCLTLASGFIPSCCNGKIGGRVVSFSCQLRYEAYLFFETSPSPPLPPPSSPPVPEGSSSGSAARRTVYYNFIVRFASRRVLSLLLCLCLIF